jgi:hypothetical protein
MDNTDAPGKVLVTRAARPHQTMRGRFATEGGGDRHEHRHSVGDVEMRIAKVVGLAAAEDELFLYVVLEDVSGDGQLAIAIGQKCCKRQRPDAQVPPKRHPCVGRWQLHR